MSLPYIPQSQNIVDSWLNFAGSQIFEELVRMNFEVFTALNVYC